MATSDEHFIDISTPKASKQAHFATTDAPRLTLERRDLTLTTTFKNSHTKQLEEKTILHNVSGSARPGELVVIMGPSGAGKSSLLDCISGRNPQAQGTITVNGAPWNKNLKRLASYVMQDDLFYQTLTVREHLLFQARLRMGRTLEYTQRVDTVLEVRDALIGGATLRGISGGERKRLSFATEILTNPSLLFVDEPTSGLDSFMAETVVSQLQHIAREGRTVLATIHQPSSEIFAHFDQLYLVADGAVVYHGKASAAVEYFASLGYPCPSFINPSDYFMRQLAIMDREKDKDGVQRVNDIKDAWRQHYQQQRALPGTTTAPTPSTSSSHANNDNERPQMQAISSHHNTDPTSLTYEDTGLGVVSQTMVLASRNALRLVRDKIAFEVALIL